MPVILPGLFDFVTGTTSAINQQQGRLQNQNQVTSNFINSLSAFNAAQNTDDNLELRGRFAQSQGPTVLDRLDDVFSSTNNPFVAQQALLASQQAAPLLAQRTLQNPLLAQGVPTTAAAQLNAGFLGVNPILQLQANQQIQDIFAQTQGLNRAALTQASPTGSFQQGVTDLISQQREQELQALRAENARLANQLRSSNTTQPTAQQQAAPRLNTSATTQAPTSNTQTSANSRTGG